MYGEDSAIFQALSTCLSEKGSGDLLQEDDGTNRIDPILEKLEESKKEICAKIPKPPTVNFKNLDTFGDNARLQGWAVVLRDRSSFSTFKKVQDSGIQEPDSRVQVDDITGTIYGLQTVRSLVHPWKVVISDSSSPGELIVTSQAPSEEVLNKWFDECSANVGRNTIDCEKVREAVRLLKKKIALMIAPAACYGSSSGTPATVCTVPELMGGVGESPVPQNALDRSVTDVIGVGETWNRSFLLCHS
ncbi:uncharacterized protein EMH_0097750 [Eimeria mitis]|uniref:Uncharacterized protein n=1 Tax=Eimeria mitis TaxID=44415 RepID=U6KKU9_9EIME|nr:uncharacterized protein EMH_0097750 [Eimeria mitis]CDJ36867.1 hypothetical protein EMH_0097750 [Eimeria mitis]